MGIESISIALLSMVIAMIGTLITIYRGAKKETRSDAANSTSVKEEIKYISRGVEDIKFDTRSIMNTMMTMNERLTRNEESIKSAHEKIDNHIRKGDV